MIVTTTGARGCGKGTRKVFALLSFGLLSVQISENLLTTIYNKIMYCNLGNMYSTQRNTQRTIGGNLRREQQFFKRQSGKNNTNFPEYLLTVY